MKKINDFKLEQFILNELPLHEKEEIEKYLQEDILLAQKVAQMKEENEQFLRKHPFSSLKSTPKKSLTQKILSQKFFFPTFALAATFLLILPFFSSQNIHEEEIRLKGENIITIYKKTSSTNSILHPLDIIQKGDILLPQVLLNQDSYIMLLSLDSEGNCSYHIPHNSEKSLFVEAQKPLLAPLSFELDDTLGSEIFILITSPTPFSKETIHHLLKNRSSQKDKLIPSPQWPKEMSIKLFPLLKKGD